MAVAAAAGHPMPDNFTARVDERWGVLPPETKSSMAHDLDRGKPIEVAWLSGRMHEMGAKLGVPTPGHTAGHMVLLYQNRYLFTGDHLAWDREQQCLTAFRDYCWDSWSKQKESLAKLLNYSFEWVLPGHGERVNLPAEEMHRKLKDCVEWMAS